MLIVVILVVVRDPDEVQANAYLTILVRSHGARPFVVRVRQLFSLTLSATAGKAGKLIAIDLGRRSLVLIKLFFDDQPCFHDAVCHRYGHAVVMQYSFSTSSFCQPLLLSVPQWLLPGCSSSRVRPTVLPRPSIRP